MPTEKDKVTRKRRAILSADVKGYSLDTISVGTIIAFVMECLKWV